MKKKLFILAGIIFAVFLMILFYNILAGNDIKNKTFTHLEALGYEQADIGNIEIKHSFLNKLLGYNEWRIFVEFKSEPDVRFAFTYRNKEILFQGVARKSSQALDEGSFTEYKQKLLNGKLKINSQ